MRRDFLANLLTSSIPQDIVVKNISRDVLIVLSREKILDIPLLIPSPMLYDCACDCCIGDDCHTPPPPGVVQMQMMMFSLQALPDHMLVPCCHQFNPLHPHL